MYVSIIIYMYVLCSRGEVKYHQGKRPPLPPKKILIMCEPLSIIIFSSTFSSQILSVAMPRASLQDYPIRHLNPTTTALTILIVALSCTSQSDYLHSPTCSSHFRGGVSTQLIARSIIYRPLGGCPRTNPPRMSRSLFQSSSSYQSSLRTLRVSLHLL